jgi:integrase/recombinase XerC
MRVPATNATEGCVSVRLVDDGTGPTGTASQLAVGGLSLLHPEEQAFDAMLGGWRNQQLARRLAFSTVEQRERMVRAFAAHSQSSPWLWTA